jgi:hypothetical protein
MDDVSEEDRAALLALVDEALRDEGRTEPPPEAERGAWLKDDIEWSVPDEHGWIAMVPVRTGIWSPKVLVALQTPLRSGGTLGRELMDDPRLSLVRWPAIARRCGARSD